MVSECEAELICKMGSPSPAEPGPQASVWGLQPPPAPHPPHALDALHIQTSLAPGWIQDISLTALWPSSFSEILVHLFISQRMSKGEIRFIL